jgi:hypothetical protein
MPLPALCLSKAKPIMSLPFVPYGSVAELKEKFSATVVPVTAFTVPFACNITD